MRIFIILFCLLLVFLVVPVRAETEAVELQKKVSQAIDMRQATQKEEDAWAGRKAVLMARYRSLKAQKDQLLKVKAETGGILKAHQVRIVEIERKARESGRIKEELQAFLESIITRIEKFIKKDLPFLPKERADRLASIKETLARSDKTSAEKYRRAMDALEVETEYGRTVEVYQATIDLKGQSVLVDILRLGRLSMFFQTPDGKIVGHYDRAAKAWLCLPSGYHRDINKAVEMARRERAIDLVRLPIGRISVP